MYSYSRRFDFIVFKLFNAGKHLQQNSDGIQHKHFFKDNFLKDVKRFKSFDVKINFLDNLKNPCFLQEHTPCKYS